MDMHSGFFHRSGIPVQQASVFDRLKRRYRSEVEQAAQLVRLLVQMDFVSAQSRDSRRLHTADAAANDQDPLFYLCRKNRVCFFI